jgi:hypothetical protein
MLTAISARRATDKTDLPEVLAISTLAHNAVAFSARRRPLEALIVRRQFAGSTLPEDLDS